MVHRPRHPDRRRPIVDLLEECLAFLGAAAVPAYVPVDRRSRP